MEIKNTSVYGLIESIVRSGYPMRTCEPDTFDIDKLIFEKDLVRAKKLANTPLGSGHYNFLKGVIVQFDMRYPEYFSPQIQRYNWITIVSSQSKMFKLTSRVLTKDDFTESTSYESIAMLNNLIGRYNSIKGDNLDDYKKQLFKEILSSLPSGYLKWMGISTNYAQLKTIYTQRRSHKLKEDWGYFCDWIEKLPMSELITGGIKKSLNKKDDERC